MLNLSKGQSIDLSKEAAKAVTKIRVGAGWDAAAEGKTIDLDLWLIGKGIAPVYFNNKSVPGATLDGDDRTGGKSADGADENINIVAADLTAPEYTVVINLYDAKSKGQFLKDIKRAFVEIVDTETDTKIAEYSISEDGGENSALIVGKLTKEADGGLHFHADHRFTSEDIIKIVTDCGGQA